MKNISDDELLDLYELNHSTVEVAKLLNNMGVQLTDRAIRYRLGKAFPGYWTKDFKRGDRKDDILDEDEEPVDPRPIAGGTSVAPDKRRQRLFGKRFVFTAAQNNTFIHEDFFAALNNFCALNDAQLVVSKFTYNKHGFQNGTKEDGSEDLWYDERLEPFFVNESAEVADDLIFCGELDILPTASNPLSGFENYTQNCSGIIPHAKVQMVSLPRMSGEDPRFLYTTGAITLRNYIQRKAGQKAEFHHVFGALYVEIDDNGVWFARQLIADNTGMFFDLTTRYTATGTDSNWEVEAINWGDIHIEKMEPEILDLAWGDRGSMLSVLNPTYQFIHDLTDFRARNHHNIKDPYFLAAMHFENKSSVEADMDTAAEFLEYVTRRGNQAVVVESNHDLAYQRWLKEADISTDPINAEFYHTSNARMYKSIREGDGRFSIFEWALNEKRELDHVIFLREDDSFVICNDQEIEYEQKRIVGGIECGMHGHRGPNGARGSSRSFRSVGRKVNVGHSHSAGIIDGVYTAGVSAALEMGYNKGPSSWSHSHIITYKNGKRTIITMKKGKWRA